MKKSRKRSIKEAKARRAETDRQVAAAERDRDRADAQAKAARAAQAEAEVVRVEAKRQAEEARAQAARITQAAEGRARVIVSDAKLVGAKALQKARKRAVRETQSLRDEVQQMKADTGIELRRGQLAAAYVRGRTFQLQERARNLSRDIAVRAKIWADRERQHRQQELRLAQIEKERVAAEAAITQAQDTAARVLAAAEARAEKAQGVQEKVDADRNEVDQLAMAAQGGAVRITQAAVDRAGVIVADAIALATVTVRKSRKRAVADARARRANAERVAAAIEREREATEARAELARQALARAQSCLLQRQSSPSTGLLSQMKERPCGRSSCLFLPVAVAVRWPCGKTADELIASRLKRGQIALIRANVERSLASLFYKWARLLFCRRWLATL